MSMFRVLTINTFNNRLKFRNMKTRVVSLVVLFVLGTFTVFAAEKTEKFKVKGNCGMCEKRIEKAAKAVEMCIRDSRCSGKRCPRYGGNE